ncbi:hypothetical protein [Cellulophaga tyrosinoxydans]|nr:hypothetical protein [Cellulophaga tyrosinoxydans]
MKNYILDEENLNQIVCGMQIFIVNTGGGFEVIISIKFEKKIK